MKRLRAATMTLAILAALLLSLDMASGQAPSYFRHDGGLPAVDDRSLPDMLEPDRALWSVAIPPGHSTPAVVGDRILLTAHEDGRLSTICLRRADGQQLWKQTVEVEQLEKVHAEGSPAAASPACDGRRVVSFFGSYGLVCYDLDGKLLWSKRLGPFRDEFGSASSPILADGKVILNEDHDLGSFLLALDQETGQQVWQTSREGFTRSYSTPVIWRVGEQNQLVVSGALQLVAYDLATGGVLWSLDGFARIVNTTPTTADGLLYVCTWSPGGDSDARIAMEPWSTAIGQWDKNQNGQLENEELPAGEVRSRFFRIDLDSNQALDEAEWTKYAKIFELAQNTLVALRPNPAGGPPSVAWEYKRGLPYVASPLVYRGQVVLVKDGGIVTLLNAATGKLVKQARAGGEGNYYASPVAGDGKIYLASGRGVVSVLRAGKGEALSSHDFGERIAATPVIVDGQVYLRTEKRLYRFGE